MVMARMLRMHGDGALPIPALRMLITGVKLFCWANITIAGSAWMTPPPAIFAASSYLFCNHRAVTHDSKLHRWIVTGVDGGFAVLNS